MNQNTFTVEVQVPGNDATQVEVAEGSTAKTIYSYVRDRVGLSFDNVRVLVNSRTVEPSVAETVELNPGDLIDVVPEISNG